MSSETQKARKIAEGIGWRRPAKYRAHKTEMDGIIFASKKEARRWSALRQMEKAKLITELQRQVRYELIPKQRGERAVHYSVDFQYRHSGTGAWFYEDVKGVRTPVFIIKKKLMLHIHKIRITEV